MRKVLSFVMTLVMVMFCSPSTMAYEADDPCLLYGYDPDTRNDYETYGDEAFLRYIPVKSPTGDLNIILNSYATKKIIDKAKNHEDVCEIVSEDYFPELDIAWMYCNCRNESEYELLKNSSYSSAELYITLQINDNSKEVVTSALKSLAPRIDIDIKDVIHYSYDLSDVSAALKVIAGWDVSYSVLYNYDRSGDVELSDVVVMLKAIARWENDGWFLKS